MEGDGEPIRVLERPKTGLRTFFSRRLTKITLVLTNERNGVMPFYLLAYVSAWQRYFDFTGRSTRKEFWLFFLLHFVVTVLFIAVDISFP